MDRITPLYVYIIISITISISTGQKRSDSSLGVDELGKSAAQIVELRGYISQVYRVKSDKHELELVRVINPKTSGPSRKTILFIHGFMSNANIFLINSADARPRNLTNLDVKNASIDDLSSILARDPASKSLPFLFSNLNCDVWLLNRRPVSDAKATNLDYNYDIDPWSYFDTSSIYNLTSSISSLLTSAFKPIENKDFWNYSFDEQAINDLPRVIDYILDKTNGSKLSIVSHSAGSAMVLMMLSSRPEYSDKLSRCALLAVALDLGNDPQANKMLQAATALEPVFSSVAGPIDLKIFSSTMQAVTASLCRIEFFESQTCQSDGLRGESGGQNVNLAVEDEGTFTTHELAQLLQSVKRQKMRKFDYGSDQRNRQQYSKSIPPLYDIESIRTKGMSIWQGATDALVAIADYEELLHRFNTPVEAHIIGGDGVYFNHISFLLHKNVTTLFNIPLVYSMGKDDD